MAILITVLLGWFAFEAIRSACFSRDDLTQTIEPKTQPLTSLAIHTLARTAKSTALPR